MERRQKVIIIGGGFGGCAAAKKLGKHNFDILLFDKKNHHLFQPLLYQVATAMLSPAQIAYPIRAIFKKLKNIHVLLGNIIEIDVIKKYVRPEDSDQKFYYDYLIIASGARHSYFDNDNWERYAWGLKTTEDALNIRERMLYSFEKAERTKCKMKQKKFSTFVIVGAGPTGVEIAGAIAEVTRKSIVNDFKAFDPRNSLIILLEANNRILNSYSVSLSRKAQEDLEKMGVKVKLNSKVSNITEDGVYVGKKLIPTENVIWAAGNIASPLVHAVTKSTNKFGQAVVSSDFSIKESKEIFCIGDCAFQKDVNGVDVPSVAQGAIQAGNFVADQIIFDLKKKKRQRFSYKNKGEMATIGKSKAIASIYGFDFSGFFAWLLWCIIHIIFLIEFRNRVVVILDWLFSYFTNRRSVRLINKRPVDLISINRRESGFK